MQVIEDLTSEVDRRVNDFILAHLSFFLNEAGVDLEEPMSRYRLRANYEVILRLYVRHKRAFKKAVAYELPMLQDKYSLFLKYEKLKDDTRQILIEKGIDYKEIQRNLNKIPISY